MRINVTNLNIALARKCATLTSLRKDLSPQTLAKAKRGEDIKPAAVGRIARALDIQVEDLVLREEV